MSSAIRIRVRAFISARSLVAREIMSTTTAFASAHAFSKNNSDGNTRLVRITD
jgi:hypothetical protein